MQIITITKDASDAAEKFGSLCDFSARINEAYSEFISSCPKAKDLNFIYHCFSYHGDYNFIMFPQGNIIAVDLSHMETSHPNR